MNDHVQLLRFGEECIVNLHLANLAFHSFKSFFAHVIDVLSIDVEHLRSNFPEVVRVIS